MTNIQSKIVTCSCQEFVHPWTDSCVKSVAGFLIQGSMYSLKMYGTVYAASLLIRKRIPTKDDLKNIFLGIIQSAAFLTANGGFFIGFICLWRKMFGHWTFLGATFWPTFYASILAYLIERPSRRILLTMYVLNEALETLWNMSVAQKYITPIKNFHVVFFATGISMLLYLHKFGIHKELKAVKDPIFDIFNMMIGKQEEGPLKRPCSSNGQSQSSCQKKNSILKVLETKHCTCPHREGCVKYSLIGGLKPFLGGVSINIVLKLLSSLKKRQLNLRQIFLQKDIYKLGLFIGGFSLLYKGTSCALRHVNDNDKPEYALISALIASISAIHYKNNFVSLYVLLKALQLFYYWGCEKKLLPEIKNFQITIYSLATATLFHAAQYQPTSLRPSYWNFLFGLSGSRVALFDRNVLEKFGMKSQENLLKVLKNTNTYGKPLKWAMV